VRVPAPSPRRARADTAEIEALRLAVAQPHAMLPLLHEVLFDDERHQLVLRALVAAGGDLHAATEAADPFVAEYLSRLAVEDSDADPEDVRRLLLRDAGQRVLVELQREAMDAVDKGGYSATIGWLKTEMEAAGADAPPDRHREDELLRWLLQRAEEPS
jgi:hypothetical protein